MSTEKYIGDPSLKEPLQISSLPVESDLYSYISGTIGANSQLNILWTATPDRPQLSLWNFAFTINLGVDDADHAWPNGASLNTDQQSLYVMMIPDAVTADDLLNIKQNKVVCRNNSASSIPFFFYFKAYTVSTAVGVNT